MNAIEAETVRTENQQSKTSITVEHLRTDIAYPRPVDPDLPRRVKNSARIVVLGGIIGALTGWLCLFVQPVAYRSIAQVQIVDQAKTEGTDASDANDSPVNDEIFVIRSQRILRQAAEIGELDLTAQYYGDSYEAIASSLHRSDELVVSPGRADSKTNLIRIQFDAADPVTPQDVVRAVVNAYTRYTLDRFKKGDEKVVEEILTARDAAAAQLRELELEYDDFKKRTELLFVDGEPKSIHRNTADRLLSQREELLVNNTEMESQLNAAEASLNRGDAPTTVLLALRGESETPSDVIDRDISDRLQKIAEESRVKPSARLRETQLLPLQLERKDLLENVGAKHPTIVSVDKKISVIELKLERMEAEEKRQEALIAKAMSIRDGDGELDPQAEVKKRVELALDALRQRLDSSRQQIAAINEAYAEESEAAKQEIAAARESRRLERDLKRQGELYERVLARLDDVQLEGDQGLTVFPLDSAGLGTPLAKPQLQWSIWGGGIGILCAFLLLLFSPSRKRSDQGLQTASHRIIPVVDHAPLLAAIESKNEMSSSDQP